MDRLRVLATTQGYFTRADAFAAGYNDVSIHRALRTKVWRRVRVGTYTFTDLWPGDDREVHRLTARAVGDRLHDTVALSHTSGAIAHGLRTWDADLSLVHVTRLDGGAGRTQSGVVHHEGLTLPSDLAEVDGVHVLHPARVAIETASLLSPEAGLVTLDSALHLEKCTREELDEAFTLMRAWPGMLGNQLAVRMADAGSQSVGESRGRWLFYAQGLPAPQLQFEVWDAYGTLLGITDWAWPELKLFGEFDGLSKYGRLLRPGETPEQAVVREKLREDRLVEETGWRMIRLIWADLYHPARTAARIRRLMQVAA